MPASDPVSQMSEIHDYITTLYRRRGRPSSGIVYCRAKAACDELSAYLRGKGLSARPYHRGIACVYDLFLCVENYRSYNFTGLLHSIRHFSNGKLAVMARE